MTHERLFLVGHVHNRPNQIITSTYSWPLGIDDDKLQEIVLAFMKALTPIYMEADLEGLVGKYCFNEATKTFTKEFVC